MGGLFVFLLIFFNVGPGNIIFSHRKFWCAVFSFSFISRKLICILNFLPIHHSVVCCLISRSLYNSRNSFAVDFKLYYCGQI